MGTGTLGVLVPISGSTLARTASAVAVAARSRDPERIAEARRNHAAAQLEALAERIAVDSPPLTAEQIAHIGSILRDVPSPRTLRRPLEVNERIAAGGDE